MRALVLAGGESWRLPGPVPKPFRLLGTRAVVAHVVWGLENVDWITQVDVLVRYEHDNWAREALWNYECNILARATMGPAARVIEEQRPDEPLVVVLGDTLVSDHADQLKRVVANVGPRARVLVDDLTSHHYIDEGPTGGLRVVSVDGLIDVGSYYLPAGHPLPYGLPDESLLAALIAAGPLDPITLTHGARWRDVGSPEGFAAAELELVQRP